MAKPVVDRIEEQIRPVRVVRISTASTGGSQLAGRFAVRGIPTLLVINGQGEVMLRQVGRVQQAPVIAALAQQQKAGSGG